MNKPKYVVGNLFELMPTTEPVVVPHICNDLGGWGSGFVVPLGKKYPDAEKAYREWHRVRFDPCLSLSLPNMFRLGNIQVIPCMPKETESREALLWVANMIAQHGTVTRPMTDDGRPPVRYGAVASCLRKVAQFIEETDLLFEIHAPKFGAGLAGGNWDFIEELIREEWLDKGIPVTIYSLE